MMRWLLFLAGLLLPMAAHAQPCTTCNAAGGTYQALAPAGH